MRRGVLVLVALVALGTAQGASACDGPLCQLIRRILPPLPFARPAPAVVVVQPEPANVVTMPALAPSVPVGGRILSPVRECVNGLCPGRGR